jgi:hypothetical protein
VSAAETWRPIPGWDGYEVSDYGGVRSVDRIIQNLNGRSTPYRGRLRSLSAQERTGHLSVVLWQGNRGRTCFVHYLVLLAFVGPRPEGCVIRHLDGDSSNNTLANLRYGSPSENQRDAVRHGTNFNTRKTHCKRGHAFTQENTYRDGRGHRRCRSCEAARNAKAAGRDRVAS